MMRREFCRVRGAEAETRAEAAAEIHTRPTYPPILDLPLSARSIVHICFKILPGY